MPFVKLTTTEPIVFALPIILAIQDLSADFTSVWKTQIATLPWLVERRSVLTHAPTVLSTPIAHVGITREPVIADQVSQGIHMVMNAEKVSLLKGDCSMLKWLHHAFLVVPKGCQRDADCPSQQACYSGDCKNPCKEERPCVANAECTVISSLPRRTMVCTCRDGFKGQGDTKCEKITSEIILGGRKNQKVNFFLLVSLSCPN